MYLVKLRDYFLFFSRGRGLVFGGLRGILIDVHGIVILLFDFLLDLLFFFLFDLLFGFRLWIL